LHHVGLLLIQTYDARNHDLKKKNNKIVFIPQEIHSAMKL